MRKAMTILGTLLITAIILISGSVVATWVFGVIVDFEQGTTFPEQALGQPNSVHATVGNNTPDSTLGILRLDLGAANMMSERTYFYVIAQSTVSENYSVTVYNHDKTFSVSVGSGEDTNDQTFKTPDSPSRSYRYIEIHGLTGNIGDGDPFYGPEVDAVTWNK